MNDSDFADPIFESVTSGRFTAFARNLDKAAVGCHALQDLVHRNHDIGCPDASLFERHEFDEAHHHAFCTREFAERYDLVVVEAAHQHAIDLQGIEAFALGGSDSGKDASKAGRHTRYPREAFWIHSVHADCDTPQASVFSGLAISARRCPLVVAAMSRGWPSTVRSPDNSRTKSTTPLRSSGSPPVIRTFLIPTPANSRTIRRYSEKGRSS